MRVYINDSLVIVNNKFENNIFAYDRLNRIQYNINSDTFDVLEDIKNNEYKEEDLLKIYDSSFINQLFDMGILTTKKQKNINNVKRLEKYNNARIFAEITNKCNLKCKHCYGSFSYNNSTILDIDIMKKIIDNASLNGVYQFDLTGGEPLLYPYFEELLQYLYESGMLVRIFSNLTVYNDNYKNMILKYGVKDIVTSIDSCDKRAHEEFRGQIGCFDKTINAINDLKSNNVTVSVNTMIGEHNKDDIDDLVKFIDSLKVRSVLDVIVPEGRAKNLNENVVESAKIIKNIYDKYLNIIDKSAVTVYCGIGDRFIYIKSDGNIYICPSLIYDQYKIGNINSFDVKKIWKAMNSKFKNLNCKYRNEKCGKCSGGCRARALQLNGSIEARDDVYCILNEVGDYICENI